MRRWRVYKDSEDRWLRWIARPDCPPWQEEYNGYRFPEWGMAMRYANRMARTANPETYRFTTSTERLTKALSELGYKIKTSTRRTNER